MKFNKLLNIFMSSTSPAQEKIIKSGIEGYYHCIFHYGTYHPCFNQRTSIVHEAFTILNEHYQFIQEISPNQQGYFRVNLKPGIYFIFQTINQVELKDIREKRTTPHQTVNIQREVFTYIILEKNIYGC